jgi:hypothetical protein
MYDIVIVSHDKDFNKLKYVIEYANKNLTDFEAFYLILRNSDKYDEINILKEKTDKPIFIYDENDVLKIDLTKIKFRPTWIYQMMLKMFQDITKNDKFLIMESDGIINKRFKFFGKDGGTIYYLGRNQYHKPYFNFNKLLNIPERYDHSFISEFMMYDKNMIKKLLEHVKCVDKFEFIDKFIYNNINENCYPADYELYGNFLFNFYNEKMYVEKYTYQLNGSNNIINDDKIEYLIKKYRNYNYISFHTWI